MSALTPFVAIVMPPVAGLIADRIGNFKVYTHVLSKSPLYEQLLHNP